MSKKGSRSPAFNVLTASLSEEVIERYLEIAREVREQERARRREAERRKAAERKRRAALLAALFGFEPPRSSAGKRKKKKAKKTKAATPASVRAGTPSPPAGEGAAEGRAAEGSAGAPETRVAEGLAGAPETRASAAPADTSAGREAGEPAAVPAPDAPQDAPAEGRDARDAEDPATGVVARANPGGSRRAKPITREEILKLFIADDLGYLDKVRADGWGGLTSAETGRVGGMMTRRMKRVERGLPPFGSPP
ncbi:MAG: small, acid-soluble spore protein, alpha/beta type [Bacillota bacterium]|jgi:hypothetical protein